MALAGYAVGAHARLRARAARSTRARSRRWRPRSSARARRPARRGHPRQRLRLRRDDRRGRRLVRRRRGDRAARVPPGPARHRLRAAAVPRRARLSRHADGRQQRRDALQRAVHRAARRATPTAALSPGADARHRSSSASTSASRGRASTRCASARRCASSARSSPAACATGTRSRRCRSAARSAASCRPRSSTPPFDFDELAAEGCMVGHGGDPRLRRPHRHARVARHLLAFGAHESCGKCFPCRIGLQRAHEMFAGRRRRRPRHGSRRCWRRSSSASLCAHGGGMPAPIRSLLDALPRRAGAGGDDDGHVTVDGVAVDRSPDGDDACSTPRRARRRRDVPDALLRRAPGAVRRLPRLPRRRRGRARRRCPRAPRRAATACRSTPRTRPRAASPAPSSSSCCRELPEPPAEHTELAPGRRATSASASRAGRASTHEPAPRRAPPLPGASSTSCASRAGAACARATRCRATFALTATGRGFHANVAAGLDAGFRDSTCVSCGACADTCPTDAITERSARRAWSRAYTEDRGGCDDRPLRRHRHHDLRLLRRRLPPGGPRARRARSCRSARRSTAPRTRATPA